MLAALIRRRRASPRPPEHQTSISRSDSLTGSPWIRPTAGFYVSYTTKLDAWDTFKRELLKRPAAGSHHDVEQHGLLST